MLVLKRKQGQSIIIGGFLEIVIFEITKYNEIRFAIKTTEEPQRPEREDNHHEQGMAD